MSILVFQVKIEAFDSDISKSWAKDEITYLKSKNVINGYPDGSFKPNNNMSRVEFYRFINNIMDYKEDETISINNIDKNKWYFKDLQKGVKLST